MKYVNISDANHRKLCEMKNTAMMNMSTIADMALAAFFKQYDLTCPHCECPIQPDTDTCDACGGQYSARAKTLTVYNVRKKRKFS